MSKCVLPPEGWWCSREVGHSGPCAARVEPNQHERNLAHCVVDEQPWGPHFEAEEERRKDRTVCSESLSDSFFAISDELSDEQQAELRAIDEKMLARAYGEHDDDIRAQGCIITTLLDRLAVRSKRIAELARERDAASRTEGVPFGVGPWVRLSCKSRSVVRQTPSSQTAASSNTSPEPEPTTGCQYCGRLYGNCHNADCARKDERAKLAARIAELEHYKARFDALDPAMMKIDAIRNDIVGRQTVSWSAHIYPLVAALEDAGFPGVGCDKASEMAKTASERITELEAALEDSRLLHSHDLNVCRMHDDAQKARIAELERDLRISRELYADRETAWLGLNRELSDGDKQIAEMGARVAELEAVFARVRALALDFGFPDAEHVTDAAFVVNMVGVCERWNADLVEVPFVAELPVEWRMDLLRWRNTHARSCEADVLKRVEELERKLDGEYSRGRVAGRASLCERISRDMREMAAKLRKRGARTASAVLLSWADALDEEVRSEHTKEDVT